MITQAYFEDIQYQIKKELSKANYSIQIAVAWFTDRELFNILSNKADENIKIELIIINDEINRNSGLNFELLKEKGCKVYQIGTGLEKESIMHNKFCIIDSETIITGSYNWSIKAQKNHENITVISEAPDLAKQFTAEFISIKEKYFGKSTTTIDLNKVLIRLENLKNIILLDDEDDMKYQIKKLKEIVVDIDKKDIAQEINNIIDLIKRKVYSDAISNITEFINKFRQITTYIDPELSAIKLEIKALELQISSFEDEVTEIEKLIFDFEIRHNNELGEYIIKLLHFRKEKLKKEAEKNASKKVEFEEAEKDFNEYQQNYNLKKDEKILELTEEEKVDLKSKYRRASKLCHPDVVDEKYKIEAENMFNELKQAYDRNDLNKINELLNNLEKGIFTGASDKISELEKLKIIVNKLRIKRDEVERNVNELKINESFQTINKIENWDDYFTELKEKLIFELKTYELEDGQK